VQYQISKGIIPTIVNIIKYHHPDLSTSWSLLMTKHVEAIIIKICTGKITIASTFSIVVSENPAVTDKKPITKPTINPKGKPAKVTKRVAHQYSDLLDLLLKSFHFKKYALTAFVKDIIILLFFTSFCHNIL
jgi:hypothetical protein